MEELVKIWEKYHLDKLMNGYQVVYNEVLNINKRHKIKNILEVGIGTTDPTKVSNMSYWKDGASPEYNVGNSLRAWRDYLEEANVYGIEIDENVIFNEERINTFCSDSTDFETVTKIMEKIGKKMDIIIDDGLHTANSNLATLDILFPYLKKGGTYIIEDINQGDDIYLNDILNDYRFLKIVKDRDYKVYQGFTDYRTRIITIKK